MITEKEWKEKAKPGAVFYSVEVISRRYPLREGWESLGHPLYEITKHKIEIDERSNRANYAMAIVPCGGGGFASMVVTFDNGWRFEGYLFKEECFWNKEEAKAFAKQQKIEQAKYKVKQREAEWKTAQKELERLKRK